MKRYIFKMIDKYYIEKFKDMIENELAWYKGIHMLDFEIIETKLYISIKVKKNEYKESLFKTLCIFSKKSIIKYLYHNEYVVNHIKHMVEYYIKNEVK